MNLLDLLVLTGIAAAAYAGYRLGFAARVLSWAGLFLGVFVAVRFLEDVVTWVGDSDPQVRVIAATGFLIILASLGQMLGLTVGSLLHLGRSRSSLGLADRLGGAVIGGVSVLVLVWLVTPALANAPGWTARAARSSTILAALDDLAPDPPNSMDALSRLVRDAPFPEVFGDLRRSPNPGTAPATGVPAGIEASVRASTVKIVGQACRRVQEGSGFVVGTDLVVTNAHVVAGEAETEVLTEDGRRLFTEVVTFDPGRDLALLHVPNLGLASLPLGNAEEGDTGAVFGHPGGGPLRAAPARIAEEIVALGTDIYGTNDTRREVFVLAAALEPGDSGGALVDHEGTVVGVAFAVDPADAETSYALTDVELEATLERGGSVPVDTGPCLAG